MHAIQIRCLKCGSVFDSSGQRVKHCTCCFADGTYLKSVLTDAPPPDLSKIDGTPPSPAP
jgi:hypothetical protein